MSGRKNALKTFQIFAAADMTGDLTSPVTNIEGMDNIGIQLNLTGTASGTFSIQVSLDYAVSPAVAGNWTTITTQVVTSGAPSPITFDLNQLSSMNIRTIYTHSTGSGTVTGFICGKML